MERSEIAYTDYFEKIMAVMVQRGLLLGAYDEAGKANAMTIGWGSVGSIWGIPTWTVLVRPSRYTYQCLEHSQCFTVNVPGADLAKACALCGSKSGRDMDKLAASGLIAHKADKVAAPILDPCPIVFQCKVVHRNYVVPSALAKQVQEGMYVNGDYHAIYYGQILAAHATADAAQRLK